jgi:hypothetical protein
MPGDEGDFWRDVREYRRDRLLERLRAHVPEAPKDGGDRVRRGKTHGPEVEEIAAMNAKRLTYRRRLELIAELLEAVDNRCMAVDGPVTPTRLEITDKELQRIYVLAKGQ